jgi:hypothetical protein
MSEKIVVAGVGMIPFKKPGQSETVASTGINPGIDQCVDCLMAPAIDVSNPPAL